jgi:mono/diheme cytochrome c family protein
VRTHPARESRDHRSAAAWLALASLIAAAQVIGAESETALHFVRNGTVVRTVDRPTLEKNCAAQTVSLDDPYYGRPMRFRACPLAEVLRIGFGEPVAALSGDTFLLRARDGYAKPASGARLLESGGFLAFADADHAHGDDPGWQPIERKQANPGPYYMVWTLPPGTDWQQYPWPYELTTIEITSLDAAFPHIAPRGAAPDSPAQLGFTIFRQQCIACHAINREGGTIGPDLNVPQSIVEYRPVEQIKAYIRNPQTFRYTNMPAHPQLTDAELDGLVAYFSTMKGLKYDVTPTP